MKRFETKLEPEEIESLRKTAKEDGRGIMAQARYAIIKFLSKRSN